MLGLSNRYIVTERVDENLVSRVSVNGSKPLGQSSDGGPYHLCRSATEKNIQKSWASSCWHAAKSVVERGSFLDT
ncbi:hypothetical protein QQP08_007287 [Theobroma cacao]|nr:hypothetical protein QQP08_007287 [Theobroma cacao]